MVSALITKSTLKIDGKSTQCHSMDGYMTYISKYGHALWDVHNWEGPWFAVLRALAEAGSG